MITPWDRRIALALVIGFSFGGLTGLGVAAGILLFVEIFS